MRTQTLNRMFLLFIACLSPVLATADASKANAYLDELRARGGFPSVSASIAVDGAIVWTDSSGFADIASETEATPQTVYRLGSVSKMVAAAAVALLVQDGKLDLDAPVQQYVPEYPVKEQGVVTTRLLAAHLSGVPHYQAGDKQDTQRPNYDSVIAAMAEYKDKPLLFAPGTKEQYSTYGYNLISAVVERAAGKPFPDYLQEAVFGPLGMASSRCERTSETVPGIATFYDFTGRTEISPLPPMFLSYKWAGGGMLSTVEDLARFGTAWLPGSTLFTPETLALVFTSQKTNAGEETGVGIGWRLVKNAETGRVAYHHGGAIGGGRAFIAVLPEERVVVSILANLLAKDNNFDLPQALELVDAFHE